MCYIVCNHLLLVHIEGLEGLHGLGELVLHLPPTRLLRPRCEQNEFAVGNCCDSYHVPREAAGLLQELKRKVVPAEQSCVISNVQYKVPYK